MIRLLLTTVFICGVLAFCSLTVGCASRTTPQNGNAHNLKAEKARKQAEVVASSVHSGAMKHQTEPQSNAATARGGSSVTVISPAGITQIKAEPPAPPPQTESDARPSSPDGSRVQAKTSAQVSAVTESTNQPTSPLRPGLTAVIRERVSTSGPFANDPDAEENVLTVAQNLVEQRLAQLDPPVKYRPSLNEVKTEFFRKESRSSRKPTEEVRKEYAKLHPEDPSYADRLKYVSYDVEVTSDQIRELRARDRITMVFRAFAGLTLAALACFLFLRADEWTKGYLTHWLGFAAVALVGGIVAAIFLV